MLSLSVQAVSKPEDLDEIRAQLMDVEDWLYDEGEEASGTEYKAKLRELGDLIDPIEFRAEEAELRPKAFDSARQFATGAVEILDKWATSRPWVRLSTSLPASLQHTHAHHAHHTHPHTHTHFTA